MRILVQITESFAFLCSLKPFLQTTGAISTCIMTRKYVAVCCICNGCKDKHSFNCMLLVYTCSYAHTIFLNEIVSFLYSYFFVFTSVDVIPPRKRY